MKRYLGFAGLVLFAGALQAQMGGMAAGVAAEAKQAYNQIKTNITAAADAMPEANYSFKPVPEEMSFGQWVAHVADSQMGACSRLNGQQKTLGAAQKTSKADLVEALKESFTECDATYNAITDANASEMVSAGRGQRSRVGVLAGITTHDNECYGSMAVYLRLKGIVPPSTAARGMMNMKKQ
jgi:uncharacterized damage-inducible protein DinB